MRPLGESAEILSWIGFPLPCSCPPDGLSCRRLWFGAVAFLVSVHWHLSVDCGKVPLSIAGDSPLWLNPDLNPLNDNPGTHSRWVGPSGGYRAQLRTSSSCPNISDFVQNDGVFDAPRGSVHGGSRHEGASVLFHDNRQTETDQPGVCDSGCTSVCPPVGATPSPPLPFIPPFHGDLGWNLHLFLM